MKKCLRYLRRQTFTFNRRYLCESYHNVKQCFVSETINFISGSEFYLPGHYDPDPDPTFQVVISDPDPILYFL